MSTLLEKQPSESSEPDSSESDSSRIDPADEVYLEDRTPEWLKSPAVLFGFTAVVGLLFVVLSYQKLWHTDLWGHLSYGRLIWQGGSIPNSEPLMPLAKGMPFVDTAWGSQLIGFGMHTQFGVPGIQFLYALSVTGCAGLLLWRFYRRTGHAWISLLGIAAFLCVNHQQLLIVRPQLAGLACFTALLTLITSRRWSLANWFVVPALFVLWANLHGSFPVGIAVLGAMCVGRGCDVYLRTRRVMAVRRDRWVRRYFVLTELAAVAALINPYGLGLYFETFNISSNPNLAALVEWEPLTLNMQQGRIAAVCALLLAVLYRLSPRRVSARELLLVVGLGGAALWTSRLIVWWAPVAAYFVVLHGNAVWSRYRKQSRDVDASNRRGVWSVASIGLAWICFAYTPFGTTLLHGQPERAHLSLSNQTPVTAAAYLNEHPPIGQIFNTYEWGDYLVWAGPADLKVFVASHAHLVPEEVWQDYLHVIHLTAGWENVLDRYSVNTIVIDHHRRESLIERIRQSDDWQLNYDDATAAIFTRRQPI